MKVGLLYFLVTFLLLCPHASSLSDEGIHRSFLLVFVLVKIFNSFLNFVILLVKNVTFGFSYF